jgi:DNA-binding MarR family transcriptional regulator
MRVKKGWVSRERATDDRWAIAIRLRPEGHQQAAQAADWPDFWWAAVETLPPAERTIFCRWPKYCHGWPYKTWRRYVLRVCLAWYSSLSAIAIAAAGLSKLATSMMTKTPMLMVTMRSVSESAWGIWAWARDC